MRTRRPSPEHQAAISRRLALLGDELAGVRPARPEPPPPAEPTTSPWWDEHTRPAAPRRRRRRDPSRDRFRRSLLARRLRCRSRAGTRHDGPGAGACRAWTGSCSGPRSSRSWRSWSPSGWPSPAGGWSAARPIRSPSWRPPPPAAWSSSSPAVEPAPARQPRGGRRRPTTVTVDVAGKVRHPGIAVLDEGARVVDALEAAGGARPGVDLTGLNLARVLVDGEQVVVGVPAPSGAAAAASPAPGAPSGPPGRAGQPQHRHRDRAGHPARGRPGHRGLDPGLA